MFITVGCAAGSPRSWRSRILDGSGRQLNVIPHTFANDGPAWPYGMNPPDRRAPMNGCLPTGMATHGFTGVVPVGA